MLSKHTLREVLRGWLVVFVGCLFYLYQFTIRVSPNVMNDDLMLMLSIDAATLGSLIGIYYWAYSLMQLPLGVIMDRIGPRYFICAACFLCALSCYLFGNAQNFYIAGAARFMMGMGSACGLVGTIKLGTLWIDSKHIAKVTALTIFMGTIGAGLGGMPLKYVITLYGVSFTMELLAFVGVILGFIVYISLRVHPPILVNTKPDIYKNDRPLANIVTICRNPQVWITALYGMLMYAPITIIGIGWGVPFIEKAYGIDEMLAASVVSTMFLGSAIGSPLAAFLSDVVLKNRRTPMIIGAVLGTVVWSTVLLAHDIPLPMMYVLFFCGGIMYTFKTLTFASVCEIMPSTMSGTSIAFINMIVMSTGIVFHPLIGNLINLHWDGAMVDGAPMYLVSDYRFALLVIPISLAISAILVLFMRESHPSSSIVKEFGSIPDIERL